MPEQALLRVEETAVLALSAEVEAAIASVLGRPHFAASASVRRQTCILDVLRGSAV